MLVATVNKKDSVPTHTVPYPALKHPLDQLRVFKCASHFDCHKLHTCITDVLYINILNLKYMLKHKQYLSCPDPYRF